MNGNAKCLRAAVQKKVIPVCRSESLLTWCGRKKKGGLFVYEDKRRRIDIFYVDCVLGIRTDAVSRGGGMQAHEL